MIENPASPQPKAALPRWVVALVVVTIVGAIVSLLIRFLTPKPVFVPVSDFITENKDGGSTKFSQVVFKGTPPEPRESLSIVSVSSGNLSLSSIKDDLLETYDLKRIAGLDSAWSGEKYSFYYDELQDSYILNSNFDPPENKYIKDVPSSILAAQEFISTTFPDLDVVPQKNLITYFVGTRHIEEIQNSSKANFVVIPFSYVVDELPAYIEHQEAEAFIITINANEKVQRIIFQPHFVVLSPIKQAATIPFDQALININNNQASIVSAYERSIGIFTLDEIVSGELTEVSLEYRIDLKNEIGYPFYKFKGNLINTEGKTISAEIITPAVLVK